MSTRIFDVAVVGAGLGGACAALALAQRGAKVVVLESAQFPRHKVCGEFLSPEIFQTFARLNIEENVRAASPIRVEKSRVYAPQKPSVHSSSTRSSSTRCLEIDLPRDGWGLSRYALDAILWRSLQNAGVVALSKTRVQNIERCEDGFRLQTKIESFHARFVINAAGRNARLGDKKPDIEYSKSQDFKSQDFKSQHQVAQQRVQRYVGFKAHFRDVKNYDGAVELHAFDGGYCGVGAVENDVVNICALAKYQTVAGRSPDEFWHWQLGQSASLRARIGGATLCFPWLSTANVTFGRRAPTENGVFNCGDSAGYIHPLTGNGMAMAARSGEIVACLLACALRGELSSRDVEEIYAQSWNREFATRLDWASRLEPLLVSSRLTSVTLAALRFVPAFSQRLVTRTRGI